MAYFGCLQRLKKIKNYYNHNQQEKLQTNQQRKQKWRTKTHLHAELTVDVCFLFFSPSSRPFFSLYLLLLYHHVVFLFLLSYLCFVCSFFIYLLHFLFYFKLFIFNALLLYHVL